MFGHDKFGACRIRLGLLGLAWACLGLLELAFACPAVIDVVFQDFDCAVSLPTSARFRARRAPSLPVEEFDIMRLDGAEVSFDGSVLLADGIRLSAVEVIPTHLPYEPSNLDQQILKHVIAMTGAYHCFRNLRDEVPEIDVDVVWLDYGRVAQIEAPLLKVIRGFIADNDPDLRVSNQKIADTLAIYGIRSPTRRRSIQNL